MAIMREDEGIGAVDNATSTVDRPRIWTLGVFFVLSAAASWTVWLWPLERQGSWILVVLGWQFKIPFLLAKLVVGNCLPGILAVIWVMFEGRDQFRKMLSTLTKWKTPFRWYLIAFALPCGVSLIALDAVLLYFPTEHHFPPALQFFKTLLMTLPFGPLWEELAWRAFALRKLESRYSRLVSALLLGVYWGVWHIPLWLVEINRVPINKTSYVLTGVVTLIAWSVVWSYLYHRSSESLPVVILLHATYGAATTQAGLVVPQFNIYATYVSAALALCLAIAFARALTVIDLTEY
jgi:membrane protease YdiL (CAAX protease family)